MGSKLINFNNRFKNNLKIFEKYMSNIFNLVDVDYTYKTHYYLLSKKDMPGNLVAGQNSLRGNNNFVSMHI